ncbi:hypothetical protein C0068_02255 [Zhongshania marina]|uniref:Uncharacterized protein n=1 Tax=Zhongshania marina TaxID=2304603 RepID=A0A2S4HJN0_9GAMM|nr:hypothetical protein C0068_02255 [Marortus luteolus]
MGKAINKFSGILPALYALADEASDKKRSPKAIVQGAPSSATIAPSQTSPERLTTQNRQAYGRQ